jgi:hypothetical protein
MIRDNRKGMCTLMMLQFQEIEMGPKKKPKTIYDIKTLQQKYSACGM